MNTLSRAQLEERANFIAELARRLHIAGVTASRLEGAVLSTARELNVSCEIWSTPTGLILSFSEVGEPHVPIITRLMSLAPADMDLSALVTLDEVAEDVIASRKSIPEARETMRALDRRPRPLDNLLSVGSFSLSAAGITGLLGSAWIEIALAALIGAVIGCLAVIARDNENMKPALEAIAAFVATFLATTFATFVQPISLQTVVVASLIVMMPGLTLTNAVAELAAQQLITGTTRFAGAMMTLLKLTFGSVAASQLSAALQWTPQLHSTGVNPAVPELVALVVAALALAISFRAPARDIPLVMVSAAAGYLLTRAGHELLGFGNDGAFAGAVFFASIIVAVAANIYGRLRRRPLALVRVPGIMLLVPGSAGFRGVASVMQEDYAMGLETGVAVIGALIALAAGLLCGSVLIPPRRYL